MSLLPMSPDGAAVAIVHSGAATFHDARSGHCLGSIALTVGNDSFCDFDGRASLVVRVGGATVVRCSLTGRELGRFELESDEWSRNVSTASGRLLTVKDLPGDREYRIRDTRTGEILSRHLGQVGTIALSRDGTRIAFPGEDGRFVMQRVP